MGHRLVLVVVAMVGLGMQATTAGAADRAELLCGQTITTSVELRADLTCSGDGLIIVANGVTVDLDGHSITSIDGTGAGIRMSAPTAPPGPACVDGVEVRRGTISGFAAGIAGKGWCGQAAMRVSGMTLTGNTWGVDGLGCNSFEVDRTTIVGPNGIGAPYAPGACIGFADVTRSSIQITSPTGVSLIGQFGAHTIDSSRLEGGQIFVNVGVGSVTDSRLTDVTISCGDSHLSVTDSRLSGGGIVGTGCGYAVTGNRFVGPTSGTAIAARGTIYPTEVTDNHFSGWDTAISLDGFGSGISTRTTITGNTFRSNGVGVSGERANLVGTVSANSFLDNRGTGLVLGIGWWHVGSNTALRNGGLGIDAQGPQLTVTDDGGNVARHNQPPQCIGVVCSSH